MRPERVSEARIRVLAERLGLELTDVEATEYTALVQGAARDLSAFRPDECSPIPTADVERPPGRAGEDGLNAWITRCEVAGGSGPLGEMRVGLKDSIALTGYPMTCGSRLLDDYRPSVDATVARRILEGGGTVVGKCNMEAFAWSGSSDISDYGTVPNPHDPAFLAGGSSSGSAAAVAAGDCEASIGTDQGGSIRIPAAWCGVVGLKPTHGLVPYSGVVPLDPTIDHAGPIATDVETAARVLEVIAGEDVVDGIRMDPRQPPGIAGENYTDQLDTDPSGLRVGVLREGFGWGAADPAVETAVRGQIDRLGAAGVEVEEVSVPGHRNSLSLIAALETQGGYRTALEHATPTHQDGWYWAEFAAALHERLRDRMDELPPPAKLALLLGEHLAEVSGVGPYARSKNAVLRLRREYDRVLAEVDALVMPTVPMRPFARDPDLSLRERLGRIVANHRNTATFDHTHHPALSVPCGTTDGLPVGIQVVGARLDELTLFQLGRLVETTPA